MQSHTGWTKKEFLSALRQYPEASSFYSGCTQEQQQAIFDQVRQMDSLHQLQGFLAHLPSSAL